MFLISEALFLVAIIVAYLHICRVSANAQFICISELTTALRNLVLVARNAVSRRSLRFDIFCFLITGLEVVLGVLVL